MEQNPAWKGRKERGEIGITMLYSGAQSPGQPQGVL
jgi:hypothetical protein